MTIVQFPKKPKRHREAVSPRDIYAQDKPTDLMCWEVCRYLRPDEPCMECPDAEHDEDIGETFTRMCRALADEACRVVMAAKERG